MEKFLKDLEKRIENINTKKNNLTGDVFVVGSVSNKSCFKGFLETLRKGYCEPTFLSMYPKKDTRDLGFLFSMRIKDKCVLDFSAVKNRLREELLNKNIVFMESEERGKTYFHFFVKAKSQNFFKSELELIYLDIPDYNPSRRSDYSSTLSEIYKKEKEAGEGKSVLSLSEKRLSQIFSPMLKKSTFSLKYINMEIEELSELYVFIAKSVGAIFQEAMLDDSIRIIVGEKQGNWNKVSYGKEYIVLNNTYDNVKKRLEKDVLNCSCLGYTKITDKLQHTDFQSNEIVSVNSIYGANWINIERQIEGEMEEIFDNYPLFYSWRIETLQDLANYISQIIVSDKENLIELFGEDVVEKRKQEAFKAIASATSERICMGEETTFSGIVVDGAKKSTCVQFYKVGGSGFGISKINLIQWSLEKIVDKFKERISQ